MTQTLCLSLELTHFWHVGTGKGSGNHLDALVEKDACGLPLIPGRMMKGLLRDAVHRLMIWGHYPARNVVTLLFGSSGFSSDGVPRNETQAGCLRFSDAVLETEVRHWLSQPEQKDYHQDLYEELYTTAISTDTGVAEKHSLRGIQVTIPMCLQAEITAIHETQATDWVAIIKHALPLVQAVGAYRSRGLGRAILQLKDAQA